MELLAAMAGFFAAHGIWSVSENDDMSPIYVAELEDGSRPFKRFATQRLEDGAALARQEFEANPDKGVRGVLVADVLMTLESGKIDALLVDARHYLGPARFSIAFPYRKQSDPRGFAVHRPKVISSSVPNDELDSLFHALFAGVDSHEHGAKVWNDHLDESI